MEITPILIGVLLGSIVVWLYLRCLHEKLKEGCRKGLERFIERRNAKKEAAKAKIITALKTRGSLKNEEIADLAKISSATVVRYMDELENERKVVQVGETGKSVVYRLNTSHGV